mmetsp:Transcript_53780/g.127838  ORF Transcript_53780/g.127838 Transcript_53780/m.127838 type:complete len:205 (-) Transcript_53780:37-651(-)
MRGTAARASRTSPGEPVPSLLRRGRRPPWSDARRPRTRGCYGSARLRAERADHGGPCDGPAQLRAGWAGPPESTRPHPGPSRGCRTTRTDPRPCNRRRSSTQDRPAPQRHGVEVAPLSSPTPGCAPGPRGAILHPQPLLKIVVKPSQQVRPRTNLAPGSRASRKLHPSSLKARGFPSRRTGTGRSRLRSMGRSHCLLASLIGVA